MTDYYYQADQEDPPEEDRRRRPSPADQYPADRAFFTGRDDGVVADRGDEDPPLFRDDADEPPYRSATIDMPVADDEAYAGLGDDPELTVDADAGSDVWRSEPYSAEADEADYYPAEAEDDAAEAGSSESEPTVRRLPPPTPAAERTSVAAEGLSAARRIRFDPTQERGAGHYTSAHRHSRVVRVLKFALPAVAVTGILVFLAFVQFAPAPDDAIIKLSGINIESDSVTMQTPHINGFDGIRRAYEVTAARAIQDLSNPKIVTMEEIVARLKMDDGATAHLKATTGTYNDDTKKMVLSKGISVETTNGYKATFEDAQIDINTSEMTSSKPLTITTEQAVVKANAVDFKDNGKHVLFKNGVTVFFTPPPETKDGEAAAPAATATPATPATPVIDAPKAPEAAAGGST